MSRLSWRRSNSNHFNSIRTHPGHFSRDTAGRHEPALREKGVEEEWGRKTGGVKEGGGEGDNCLSLFRTRGDNCFYFGP